MDQKVDIQVEEMKPESLVIGINNVYKHKAPPKDHPNGIFCPNCGAWTWRTARECVECPFDLWLYFEEIEKERRKKILKTRSNVTLVITLIFLILGYILFNYISTTIGSLLFLCMVFSLWLMVQLDQAIDQMN